MNKSAMMQTCRQRHITLVNFLKWARRGRAEAASRRAKLLHLSSQQGRGPGLIIPGDPRSRAEPGGEVGGGQDVHRNPRHGQVLLQEQFRLKWRCRACKSKAAFDQHCWLICRQRLCSPIEKVGGWLTLPSCSPIHQAWHRAWYFGVEYQVC